MRLLVITNLFPPQELGGYGRAMADFACGLEQRGHQISILSSDAPYLQQFKDSMQPKATIKRSLRLKGTFHKGVHHLNDPLARERIDIYNQKVVSQALINESFDGILLGNLDLIGPELLMPLLNIGLPVLHHIGFIYPPFGPNVHPQSSAYQLIAASHAVRQSLIKHGLPAQAAPVIYPGARCELFGPKNTGRSLPSPLSDIGPNHIPLGEAGNPLRICFAGLMMSSKSPHTLIEALLILRRKKIKVDISLAGGSFQAGYCEAIQAFLKQHELSEHVQWFGHLSRDQLARYYGLHHIAVFSSVHPEAFGIVAAEAMASGLLLVTSGVGGAAELVEDGVSGLRFKPGDAESLASVLQSVTEMGPNELRIMARCGQQRVREHFSVKRAAAQLEELFETAEPDASESNNSRNFGHITF